MNWLTENWVQILGVAATVASWFGARNAAQHSAQAGTHAEALKQGADLVRNVLDTLQPANKPAAVTRPE
jgi:hypothetical protein